MTSHGRDHLFPGWFSARHLLAHALGAPARDGNHLSHRVSDASGSFEVFEYLHDMDRRLAWADLVVCRSGASTVAEVCACQKAAIFIPLPTAADDHQRKNAEVLAQAGAAVMLLQSNLDAEKFRAVLISFRDDRGRIAILEENVRRFQFPRAAEKIVERILDRSV